MSNERTRHTHPHLSHSRWAAVGAALAVTLGAGSFGLVNAAGAGDVGAGYTPVTPCRLIDTRAGDFNVGPRSTPLGPGESDTFAARDAQGECSAAQLPDDASALVLNVTAVRATEQTFLTFWPGGAQPNASSLNPAPGAPPTPNAVVTPLSDTGSFDVFNNRGNVGLIVDVVGVFTALPDDLMTENDVEDSLQDFETALLGPTGPVTALENQVDALDDRVDIGAPKKGQVEVIGRLDFRPYNLDSSTAVRNSGADGAFIPAGSSNNQLWATVDLPVGAQVSTVNVSLIDGTGTANLDVDFRVNGSVVNDVETTGSSPNETILGMNPSYTVIPGDVIELRARAVGTDAWRDVEDALQIVKVAIIYDEAGV